MTARTANDNVPIDEEEARNAAELARSVETLRWVRETCVLLRDRAAARVAAADPDPEWSIALAELTETVAMAETELAACGVFSA